jgi:hypothetical protein
MKSTQPEEFDLVILGDGMGSTLAAWTFAAQGQRVEPLIANTLADRALTSRVCQADSSLRCCHFDRKLRSCATTGAKAGQAVPFPRKKGLAGTPSSISLVRRLVMRRNVGGKDQTVRFMIASEPSR